MQLGRRGGAVAFRGRAWLSTEVDELGSGLEEMKKYKEAKQLTVTPPHVALVPDGTGPAMPENPVEITTLNPAMPAAHSGREVVIAQKAQVSTTSVTHKTKAWTLTWPPQERWSNPLMGWTSTADPLGNTELRFESKDQAIAYAEKHGWAYTLPAEINRGVIYKKEYGRNKYSHNFLPASVEADLAANKLKTKVYARPTKDKSHYFRPLKFHGDGEVPQHGKDPEKPWK